MLNIHSLGTSVLPFPYNLLGFHKLARLSMVLLKQMYESPDPQLLRKLVFILQYVIDGRLWPVFHPVAVVVFPDPHA